MQIDDMVGGVFCPSKAQVLFILKNFYSKYPFPSQPPGWDL
jgi:hypothetical protein